MSHRFSYFWLAAAMFHFVTFASTAIAAESADDLIKQGVELRRRGNNEGALTLFEKALAQQSSPRAFAQVGLAQQALGLWANAEAHLEKALAHPKDSWVMKNKSTLETALAKVREHIGRVEVLGEPPGATVRINGEVVATLPMSTAAHVSSGAVDVEVSAPGHRRSSRTLTVGGGQYQKVVIRLEPAAVVPSAAGVATTETATQADGPDKLQEGSADRAGDRAGEADGARNLRPLAIGAATIGVAAAATGTVLWWMAGKKVTQIENDVADGQYAGGNENWKTFETTGFVLWGLGAAGIVTGTVLWFLDRPESASRLAFIPHVSSGRIHLAANWEF